MAVNKNFVVKNGLEVNTNLLVADLDTQTVGIGTTIAPHELHVVGGIGVTNLNVTGVATIANLRIGGISTFVGFTTFLSDINVGGASTFKGLVDINGGGQANTFKVEDLTDNRVVIAGTGGELEDDGNFTFTGNQLTLGVGATVGGGLTASTVMVEDLTNNRVVIAGTGGELEDSSNFVFDGSQLILGVGATVGGALTVAGIATFASAVGIAESIFHVGDPNTSFGFPAADTFTVDTGGSERLRINSSGELVSTNGTLRRDVDTGSFTVSGGDASNSGANVNLYGDSHSSLANIFRVRTGTTERVRVSAAGSFGIGTENPSARLTVRQTAASHQIVEISRPNSDDGCLYLGNDSLENAVIAANNKDLRIGRDLNGTFTEYVRTTNDGDVGIGTTNPTGNNAVDAANEAVLAVGIATARKVFSDSLEVGGSQVISSARQLQNIASLDSTTTATIESAIANAPNTFTDIEVTGIATFKSTVKVEDLAPNRVVFVGAGDSLTDDANFTFDRSQLILGVGATVGGALTVAGATDLNGAIDVSGESNFSSGVGIADSIFHIGDDNTQIRFPAADTFTVDTGGEERLRITDSGLVKVGGNETVSTATGIQIENAGAALLTLLRNDLTISDGNTLGGIDFYGNDGGSVQQVAKISAVADGTHGDSDKPTALVFQTTNDGAGSATEKLRISNGGDVGIGTDDPARRLEIHDTAATVLQLNSTNANGTALRIQHNKTDKTFVGLAGDFITGQASNVTDSAVRASGALLFATGGGTERVRVTGIGSVGIGTVAPEHAFVVRDDGLARIRIRNDSNAANSFCSYNLKTRNGEWSMYADGSNGSDDYLKIFRQGSGTHLYFYESIDKIGINSAICQVDVNGNTLGDSKFGFLTSETNTGFHVQTNGERTLKVNDDGLISSGIVTATGGFALGIHSAGTSVVSGPVKTLNFVGSGNTFAYNASTDTIDISIAGGSGSGVTETDTTVSTVNPTGVGSFATASFRSASVIAQINQLNTDFQVGRYLMIHDGTTVTVVEESAVSTGSTMLGSFTGVIDGSNVELRVTLASAGVSTVTTKIDTVTV